MGIDCTESRGVDIDPNKYIIAATDYGKEETDTPITGPHTRAAVHERSPAISTT